jgi:hypothetical protein
LRRPTGRFLSAPPRPPRSPLPSVASMEAIG